MPADAGAFADTQDRGEAYTTRDLIALVSLPARLPLVTGQD
jgi:hypothetical protein